MTRLVTVRRLVTLVVLVVGWCALWGEINIANVLSGLVIGIAVTSLGIGTPGQGGIRLRPLVKFTRLVIVDLVVSTVTVAREILTPVDYTEEAIVAVRVPIDTRSHLLLLIVAITLTPGTAVVDADPDTGTLYLHLLHNDRREDVTAHVCELAELACRGAPDRTESRGGDQMIAATAVAGFLIAGGCAGIRLLRGPTLADRIVALDVALMSLMGGIATHAAAQRDGTNLSLLVVIAIVGFTATVAASRFIEHEATTS